MFSVFLFESTRTMSKLLSLSRYSLIWASVSITFILMLFPINLFNGLKLVKTSALSDFFNDGTSWSLCTPSLIEFEPGTNIVKSLFPVNVSLIELIEDLMAVGWWAKSSKTLIPSNSQTRSVLLLTPLKLDRALIWVFIGTFSSLHAAIAVVALM